MAVLNGTYALFALISYTIIVVGFTRSRRAIARNSNQNSVESFQRFKFSMVIWLMTSFIALSLFPYAIFSFYSQKDFSKGVSLLFDTISNLSDTVDALLYIFLYPPVKEMIKRKRNTMTRYLCVRSRTTPSVIETDNTHPANDIVIQVPTLPTMQRDTSIWSGCSSFLSKEFTHLFLQQPYRSGSGIAEYYHRCYYFI